MPTPFTIHEAKFWLYQLDANDNLASQVYIGSGCAESATLEQAFTPQRLEYHGSPSARERHVDEEHTIELQNVWLNEDGKMPGGNGRNVRYGMVIVWRDDESAVWVKRSYMGLTSRGQRLDGSSTFQTLRFRAETMTETAGQGAVPAETLTATGEVKYVDSTSELLLYTYDSEAAELVVVDSGDAEIVSDATSVEISFQGVVAMRCDSALHVTEIVAIGGSFLTEAPRLEFYLSGKRVASISAGGKLAVVDFVERTTNPEVSTDFELRTSGGEWLLSFARPKSFLPPVVEVTP